MSLLKKFSRKLQGENKYFQQRKSEKTPEVTSSGPMAICNRKIDKDLFVDLLRVMRTHDPKSAIAVLSNTTDNSRTEAGRMINKGYLPKKIVVYLQDIGLFHIERTLELIRTELPDEFGFLPISDKKAAELNFPLNVMVYGIQHSVKREFGMVLLVKKSLRSKEEFLEKVRRTVR